MNIYDVGFAEYNKKVDLPDGTSVSSIARVTKEHKTQYTLVGEEGEFSGTLRRKIIFKNADKTETPKVGDWVVYSRIDTEQGVIESVLPRTTVISRKEIGKTTNEQVIVTNVDTMCIVQGMDNDFNLRRLERYLLMAHHSGCQPIVVLNKSDVVSNVEEFISQVKNIAKETPIYAISAETGKGVDELMKHFTSGSTSVFLGSSGAGKSTLTNKLLQSSVQETREVRSDDSRGRHTTTHREMFVLPSGGIIIDTPGMRELGIISDESTLDDGIFEHIKELMTQCAYTKCDHEKTQGCAIQKAIAEGTLDEDHFRSYQKLLKEAEFAASKVSEKASLERKQEIKKIHKKNYKTQREKYSRFEE